MQEEKTCGETNMSGTKEDDAKYWHLAKKNSLLNSGYPRYGFQYPNVLDKKIGLYICMQADF